MKRRKYYSSINFTTRSAGEYFGKYPGYQSYQDTYEMGVKDVYADK